MIKRMSFTTLHLIIFGSVLMGGITFGFASDELTTEQESVYQLTQLAQTLESKQGLRRDKVKAIDQCFGMGEWWVYYCMGMSAPLVDGRLPDDSPNVVHVGRHVVMSGTHLYQDHSYYLTVIDRPIYELLVESSLRRLDLFEGIVRTVWSSFKPVTLSWTDSYDAEILSVLGGQFQGQIDFNTIRENRDVLRQKLRYLGRLITSILGARYEGTQILLSQSAEEKRRAFRVRDQFRSISDSIGDSTGYAQFDLLAEAMMN